MIAGVDEVGRTAEEREGWNTKAKRWADRRKSDPDGKKYRDYFLPLPISFSSFEKRKPGHEDLPDQIATLYIDHDSA
jgi:hypothetical protein